MWLLGWCVDGIVFGAQLRASNILSITNALLLEGWISRETNKLICNREVRNPTFSAL